MAGSVTRRRLFFGLSAGAVWALAHLGAACSDDDPVVVEDDAVIFESGANDEALAALFAAPFVDDLQQAAHFTSPLDGASVAAAEPPLLSWRVGAPSGALLRRPAPSTPALLDRFAPWLQPIRSAHAHGPPVNGRAYLLFVGDAEGHAFYRVFTTDLEHVPTAAAWDELVTIARDRGGVLSAWVVNAVFENDVIVEGGGPWQGPTITFRVE